MRGFAILLGFQLLGTFITEGLHLMFPGNVLGLILFLASLHFGWIKVEWVEDASSFLLKHMMVFFAPFVVGIIVFIPLISREWAPILLSQLAGTAVTLLVAGFTAQRWIGSEAAGENEKRKSYGG